MRKRRSLPRPTPTPTPVTGTLALAGFALGLLGSLPAVARTSGAADTTQQRVGTLLFDRTEVTITQFAHFVQATGTVTRAEREGGGYEYVGGWQRRPGWTWRTPDGVPPVSGDLPAVHLTHAEAQAYCQWRGARLPTAAEWTGAAYTEQRQIAPAPWVRGTTYPYPTGASPAGAQCLGDCGPAAQARAISHGAVLSRGHGHARAGATPAGVNGLHDMGANAWEWVDEPPGAPGQPAGNAERRTRGGSWWYGAAQMRADHLQSKPGDTTEVYIGFRCVR